jgi:hypothetical protein
VGESGVDDVECRLLNNSLDNKFATTVAWPARWRQQREGAFIAVSIAGVARLVQHLLGSSQALIPIVVIGGHRSSYRRRAQSELDRMQERNLVPLKVRSYFKKNRNNAVGSHHGHHARDALRPHEE